MKHIIICLILLLSCSNCDAKDPQVKQLELKLERDSLEKTSRFTCDDNPVKISHSTKYNWTEHGTNIHYDNDEVFICTDKETQIKYLYFPTVGYGGPIFTRLWEK